MSRTPTNIARTFIALVALFVVSACSDRMIPTEPTEHELLQSQLMTCRADVLAGAITCQGSHGDPVPGLSLAVIVGGQGSYVQLTSDNVSYDGSDVFQADVTVKNLVAQPMGTPNGTTVTGLRVFFHSGPTVTGGSGTVSVSNADGTGTFTGSNQPYFEYDEILQTNDVSAAKTWQWSVSPTVTTFDFSVYVSTNIPVASGVWEATPTPSFGTVDFTVNDQSNAVTFVRFNFDSNPCGWVPLSGSVEFGGTWSITDRELSIDRTDPTGWRFVFEGTFSALGDEASGTWELTRYGSTCSGTWQGGPTWTYSIGGTVTGLVGVGCVLQNNGADDLAISSNGPFTLPTSQPTGSSYAVTVQTQPTGPTQACAVSNGTGTVSDAAVSDVLVDCSIVRWSCDEALYLGSIRGDEGNDVVTRSGGGEDWFRVSIAEESLSNLYLSAVIDLSVPPGIDYDLYVYCWNCGGSQAGSSTAGTGVNERVSIRWEDRWTLNDDGEILIHVKYFGGSSPDNWTLSVAGNFLVDNTTCTR